jgi:hypothetical protein
MYEYGVEWNIRPFTLSIYFLNMILQSSIPFYATGTVTKLCPFCYSAVTISSMAIIFSPLSPCNKLKDIRSI